MGYTQTIILNYLRGAGPSTVEAIARTLAREERIGRSAVRVCLCRMRQAGMVDRPAHGVYTLAVQIAEVASDALIVRATLDRLLGEYGAPTRAELLRRGWKRAD